MVDKQLGGVLARVLREFHSAISDRAAAFNEHEESIVVWVVGMAVVSLALLAGQDEIVRRTWEVRSAAACLAASILFGTASRLLIRAMNLAEAKRAGIAIGNLSSIELESEVRAISPELAKKASEEIKGLTSYMRGGLDAEQRDAEETKLARQGLRFAGLSNYAFAGCMVCFVSASCLALVAFFF